MSRRPSATERLTDKERRRLAESMTLDGMNEIDSAIALDEAAEMWLAAEDEILRRQGL
jgi:hypothetical protein